LGDFGGPKRYGGEKNIFQTPAKLAKKNNLLKKKRGKTVSWASVGGKKKSAVYLPSRENLEREEKKKSQFNVSSVERKIVLTRRTSSGEK